MTPYRASYRIHTERELEQPLPRGGAVGIDLGVVPLTGTGSETHMREDLAIFEFELADSEQEAMERLVDRGSALAG